MLKEQRCRDVCAPKREKIEENLDQIKVVGELPVNGKRGVKLKCET